MVVIPIEVLVIYVNLPLGGRIALESQINWVKLEIRY